jgi:hypothetical protein
MDQLASRLGVDPQTAERATRKAVPALVQGMHANAKDPARAASLQKAIGKHHRPNRKKPMEPAEVDTADGDKIVHNVFGNNTQQVIGHLGESEGGSGLMGKLLPMVAPMVMSHLADQGKSSGAGGLGDLLGGMLGGHSGGAVGGMLSGLLGGGKH